MAIGIAMSWQDETANFGTFSKANEYYSLPISTINSTLNNTGLPANSLIRSVTLRATVKYECAALAKVYVRVGYGGNKSIGTELFGKSQIGDLSMNNSREVSVGLEIGNSASPYAITNKYGDYVTFNMSTDNIASKSFWVNNVTLDVDYYIPTYTATFKNYDGTVLQTVSVNNGSVPTYSGATPTKASTAEYDYKFSGWSPSLSAITADTVYTAQFTATKRKYDIEATAKNEFALSTESGGSVSGGGSYDYGTVITLKAVPSAGCKFVKWSDGVLTASRSVTVTGNASYSAVFAYVFVLYDTLVNATAWWFKGRLTSSRGELNPQIDGDTGLYFRFTASVDDAYTNYSPMFTVEPGKTYTFEYTASGGSSYQSFVFFHTTNGDYNWTKLFDSAKTKWTFTVPDGFHLASIRVDVNTKGETINFSNFRIYPADCDYMGNAVAANRRYSAGQWSMPTPVRDGYTFLGWNTKADGSGRYYTASSTYPSDDLVLYSVWKAAKIFIGTSQPSKIYLGTQEVKEVYVGTTKVYG